MSEENFLRYRLQVVQEMADGPLKVAIATAIATRFEVLRKTPVVSSSYYRETSAEPVRR